MAARMCQARFIVVPGSIEGVSQPSHSLLYMRLYFGLYMHGLCMFDHQLSFGERHGLPPMPPGQTTCCVQRIT